MPNSVPVWLPRDAMIALATKLRERILKGECPYPDAAMEANDSFLARLEDCTETDTAKIAAAEERKAARAEGWTFGVGAAGLAGTVALGIYAFNCAPLPASAVVAASGALAIRFLFRMAGRAAEHGAEARQFADHLKAWSARNTDAVPTVAPWKGDMSTAGLKAITRTFPEDVASFPYAAELKREHERFLAALPAADRPVPDLKTELLAQSRRPASHVGRALDGLGKGLANAGWVGGAMALALWQPWVSAGLFVGMLAGKALQIVAHHIGNSGSEDLRTARSLHYWEQSMAAAPPTAAENLVFGTQPDTLIPKQEAGTIQRSQEDVRIGKVSVPVKQKQKGKAAE